MNDHKIHDLLGQDIVKALARNAIEQQGMTATAIHGDITQMNGYTPHPSALGARIEALCRDGVMQSTVVEGITYYVLEANPREVIPSPILERDVRTYCTIS